jgi:hypothetical protein
MTAEEQKGDAEHESIVSEQYPVVSAVSFPVHTANNNFTHLQGKIFTEMGFPVTQLSDDGLMRDILQTAIYHSDSQWFPGYYEKWFCDVDGKFKGLLCNTCGIF